MSNPTTQEEKQPLSPAVVIDTFRRRQVELLKTIATGDSTLARWERHRADGAVEWADERIGNLTLRMDSWRTEAAALEQSIAILSVLEHPGFTTLALRESLSSGHSTWVWRVGITTTPGVVGTFRYIGAPDAITALLKANAALKPQEGATSGKEDAVEAP